MQYKQVDHQVLVHGDTSKKHFSLSKPLILLIYQVKRVSSLWQAANVN